MNEFALAGQLLENKEIIFKSGPQEFNKDHLLYSQLSAKISALEGENDTKDCATYRKYRTIKVTAERLREEKKIMADETMIPERTIDKNVTKEVPPFMAYIKQSRRIGIFKPKGDATLTVDALENEFTRTFKFSNWEQSFFRLADSAIFLGLAFQERVFNADEPGKFLLKTYSRDKVFFAKDTEDLQAQDCIVIHKSITRSKLLEFVRDHGWNQDAVMKIVDNDDEKPINSRPDCSYIIRKVYFKVPEYNVVFVAFSSDRSDSWLKEPRPLYLGEQRQVLEEVQIMTKQQMVEPMTGEVFEIDTPQIEYRPTWEPVYETRYPIYALRYRETEETKLYESYGRGYLDMYKQEALTSLWSAVVNRANRAAHIFASPRNPVETGTGVPKISGETIQGGKVFTQPVDFFSIPSIDGGVLSAIQQLQTSTNDDINQPAWTVQNRKDSEKTATEITAAQKKEVEINSVSITLFSVYIRELLQDLWRTTRSLALQGAIPFLENNPNKGVLLNTDYELYAAGDTDVIQREELIQKMRMDWPVISQTPAAQVFLMEFLEKSYPDSAHKYRQAFEQAMQENQQKAALIQVLQGLIDQFGNQLSPEQTKGIQQVVQGAVGQQQPSV